MSCSSIVCRACHGTGWKQAGVSAQCGGEGGVTLGVSVTSLILCTHVQTVALQAEAYTRKCDDSLRPELRVVPSHSPEPSCPQCDWLPILASTL